MDIVVLRKAFGSRPFTIAEAGWALGLRRPSGTLSRLKSLGLVEAVGRGKYRVAETDLREKVEGTLRSERLREILEGPAAVALDGPDAVAAWTKGRYLAGRVPGREIVHLACSANDRDVLLAVLEEMGVPWAEGEEWPRARGLAVRVRFVDKLARVKRNGFPVVSRAEVMRIIRADPATFEGAKEWVVR